MPRAVIVLCAALACAAAWSCGAERNWLPPDAGREGGEWPEGWPEGWPDPAEGVWEPPPGDGGVDAAGDARDGEGTGADGAADVPGADDGGDDGPPVLEDSDGDTIADRSEGDGAVDTDGDTVPDTLDPDSDDDTIPDAVEAGDASLLTPPVDSDVDGTPDFRDLDSDGDTIADRDEGYLDADGDGILNYRDIDADGDFISDGLEAGDADPATPPVDTDRDGAPDYLDPDSDGDYIGDLDEGIEDTDRDGRVDYLDLDSDGDGVTDANEAGDSNIATPPRDCGDDHLVNFRDTDSDNDGLGDAQEIARGTSVCAADTDGDGVSDMIEVAYGSNPLSAGDSPRTHGDFVFVVPHLAAPTPTKDTLVFSTNLRHADVYFLVDTTGSMGGEIDNLRSSLSSTVIPGIVAAIPDTWTGVGHFEDYPTSPYGGSGDVSYRNRQSITNVPSQTQTAVNNLTTGWGNDDSESHVTALYTVASGNPGYTSPRQPAPSCPGGRFGYPCFRSGSVPVVIIISDANFHNGPGGYDPYSTVSAPTYAATVAALTAAKIKVIGVHSDTWSGDSHYRAIATATGAVDSGGNPLVYNIPGNGSGLGTQLVNAVRTLANGVPIEVSTRSRDKAGDAVNATIFIERIEPNTVGGVPDPVHPAKVCVGGLAVADRTGDGRPDVFTRVLPGTTVCFDIYPKRNTTVAPLTVPQIYEAYVDVIGDGITTLDTRSVFFLIPPVIPGGN